VKYFVYRHVDIDAASSLGSLRFLVYFVGFNADTAQKDDV